MSDSLKTDLIEHLLWDHRGAKYIREARDNSDAELIHFETIHEAIHKVESEKEVETHTHKEELKNE